MAKHHQKKGTKKRTKREVKEQAKAQKKINSLPTPWNPKDNLIYLFITLIFTAIVFSTAINNEFVNWDDGSNIFKNVNVTQPLTLGTIKAIFTSDVLGGYNPLSIFSFAVEHHFFGLNSQVTHVNNIILHLVCTFFVYWIFLLLGLKKIPALFAALLFGIHPMRVESIAWATERKDVLFGAFYLAAIVNYIYFIKTKNKKYFYWIFPLFILALFSKIQAVSLPLSFLVIDYYFKREMNLKLIIEKIPFFLLSAAIGLYGVILLSGNDSLDAATKDFTLLERFSMAFYSFWIYIVKLIYPFETTVVYPYPDKIGILHYLTIPLFIVLGVVLYLSHKKTRIFIFGFLFFFFNIAFVLQFFGAGQGFLADRFTYIPYIGLFFLLGLGCQYLLKHFSSYDILIKIVLGLYVSFLGYTSYHQNNVWDNSIALWSDVIKKYPGKIEDAYGNRGSELGKIGRVEEAMKDLEIAAGIGKKAVSFELLGTAYGSLGRYEDALNTFNKGLALDDERAEIYFNRGITYVNIGQNQKALEDFNKVFELKDVNLSTLVSTYANRSYLFITTGNLENGFADAQEA